MGNGAFNTILLVGNICREKNLLVKQAGCGAVNVSQGTLPLDSPAFSEAVLSAPGTCCLGAEVDKWPAGQIRPQLASVNKFH